MTYRDSDIFTAGASNAPSVQATVMGTTQVGDLLIFLVARGGTNTAADLTLVSSNGGTFTQVEPQGSGLGSIGSLSKYAFFARVAVSGDAGSTVTASSAGTGRHLIGVVSLSGVTLGSLKIATPLVQGDGNVYTFPAITPEPGTTAGTVVRVALGSINSRGSTWTLPNGSPVTQREAVTTGPTDGTTNTGPNVFGFVGTQEITNDSTVASATVTGSQTTAHRVSFTLVAASTIVPTVTASVTPTSASVRAASAPFTLTGSATTSGGAIIVNRTWTRVSGEVVSLSGAGSDTVTVTPPAAPGSGTTVLRYRVNDGTTPTASADVTLTWLPVTTGPVPYSQGPGWIDARAYGSAVTLSQLSGTPASVVQPTQGVFLLSGGGSFLLSSVDGLGQAVTVVIATTTTGGGSTATGPRVELLRHDGTAWSESLVFVEDPQTSPTLLTSETLTP